MFENRFFNLSSEEEDSDQKEETKSFNFEVKAAGKKEFTQLIDENSSVDSDDSFE